MPELLIYVYGFFPPWRQLDMDLEIYWGLQRSNVQHIQLILALEPNKPEILHGWRKAIIHP